MKLAIHKIFKVTGFVSVAAQSTGRRRRQANTAETRAKAEYEAEATTPKDKTPEDVAQATEDEINEATDDGFEALDSAGLGTARNTGSLPPDATEPTTTKATTTTVTTTAKTTTTTATTTTTTIATTTTEAKTTVTTTTTKAETTTTTSKPG